MTNKRAGNNNILYDLHFSVLHQNSKNSKIQKIQKIQNDEFINKRKEDFSCTSKERERERQRD